MKIETLEKICDILEIDIKMFFGGEDDPRIAKCQKEKKDLQKRVSELEKMVENNNMLIELLKEKKK